MIRFFKKPSVASACLTLASFAAQAGIIVAARNWENRARITSKPASLSNSPSTTPPDEEKGHSFPLKPL